MKIPFNANYHIRVKLTDLGRRLHKAEFEGYGISAGLEYQPPKENREGWSRWQLWRLMQCFGDHVGNGFDLVFETNIEVEIMDNLDISKIICDKALGSSNGIEYLAEHFHLAPEIIEKVLKGRDVIQCLECKVWYNGATLRSPEGAVIPCSFCI